MILSGKIKIKAEVTNPFFRAGLLIVSLSLLLVVFGNLISPFGFDQIRDGSRKFERLEAPSLEHWFGTNGMGFDVFSRTIQGFQPAVLAVLISLFVAISIGTLLGLAAAYFGGIVDKALNSIADLFLVFPSLVVAMVIALGFYAGETGFLPGVIAAAIASAIEFIPKFYRSVRVEASAVIESGFVQISKATGVGNVRVMLFEVLPNSLKVLPVLASRQAADTVLVLASLGFLGLGITPDAGAEWGYDLNLAVSDLVIGVWWTALFPALALVLLVVGFTLIAEWSSKQDSKGKSK
jgi:peptide/nickel transport system permease protein